MNFNELLDSLKKRQERLDRMAAQATALESGGRELAQDAAELASLLGVKRTVADLKRAVTELNKIVTIALYDTKGDTNGEHTIAFADKTTESFTAHQLRTICFTALIHDKPISITLEQSNSQLEAVVNSDRRRRLGSIDAIEQRIQQALEAVYDLVPAVKKSIADMTFLYNAFSRRQAKYTEVICLLGQVDRIVAKIQEQPSRARKIVNEQCDSWLPKKTGLLDRRQPREERSAGAYDEEESSCCCSCFTALREAWRRKFFSTKKASDGGSAYTNLRDDDRRRRSKGRPGGPP